MRAKKKETREEFWARNAKAGRPVRFDLRLDLNHISGRDRVKHRIGMLGGVGVKRGTMTPANAAAIMKLLRLGVLWPRPRAQRRQQAVEEAERAEREAWRSFLAFQTSTNGSAELARAQLDTAMRAAERARIIAALRRASKRARGTYDAAADMIEKGEL